MCGVLHHFCAKSTQRDFLEDFIERSCRLQEALEIHQVLHIGMEIGLLLDAIVDLQEELLVDQRFDAAHSKVRHEVLAVAQIAQVVESIQEVGLKVEQGFGLVVHAEPKHTRHVVAAEKPRAVEVHRKRLVFFGHCLNRLDDGGNVIHGRATQEFQCQVDVFGSAIVNVLFMRSVYHALPEEFK